MNENKTDGGIELWTCTPITFEGLQSGEHLKITLNGAESVYDTTHKTDCFFAQGAVLELKVSTPGNTLNVTTGTGTDAVTETVGESYDLTVGTEPVTVVEAIGIRELMLKIGTPNNVEKINVYTADEMNRIITDLPVTVTLDGEEVNTLEVGKTYVMVCENIPTSGTLIYNGDGSDNGQFILNKDTLAESGICVAYATKDSSNNDITGKVQYINGIPKVELVRDLDGDETLTVTVEFIWG